MHHLQTVDACLPQQVALLLGCGEQTGLEVAAQHFTRMLIKGDDHRLCAMVLRIVNKMVDEKTMATMHTVEETDSCRIHGAIIAVYD